MRLWVMVLVLLLLRLLLLLLLLLLCLLLLLLALVLLLLLLHMIDRVPTDVAAVTPKAQKGSPVFGAASCIAVVEAVRHRFSQTPDERRAGALPVRVCWLCVV